MVLRGACKDERRQVESALIPSLAHTPSLLPCTSGRYLVGGWAHQPGFFRLKIPLARRGATLHLHLPDGYCWSSPVFYFGLECRNTLIP